MNKKTVFISSAGILIALFLVISLYYRGQEKSRTAAVAEANREVFNRDYPQSLGHKDAKVIITEFLDPGCETCREMHPFLKKLLTDNVGRIRLVVRYAPLHHGSDDMVRILEASREQGKYWETLELMYEAQPYWASHSHPQPELIWQYLPRIGLDIKKLKADMLKPEIEKRIQQDIADARTLSVTKTPGYFVNGRPLVEFGYQQLIDLIRSEYVKHYPKG